jgi:hypothetical protein
VWLEYRAPDHAHINPLFAPAAQAWRAMGGSATQRAQVR